MIRSWGKAGSPVVVLLHAQGCHSGWWDWVGPLLGQRRFVLAPDLRGHGAAPRADDYSWKGYVDDLAELVRGYGDWALVGHSMGGYIALEALAHGLKPRALVIADMKTGATEQELTDLRSLSERPGRRSASLGEALARYRLVPPMHCAPPERLARVAEESFRQVPDGTWAPCFDRRALAIEPLRIDELVTRVGCPSLFIRGEHSEIMPAEAAAKLAEGAGGRLVELPGLYHHLPLEAPEALAGLIESIC